MDSAALLTEPLFFQELSIPFIKDLLSNYIILTFVFRLTLLLSKASLSQGLFENKIAKFILKNV